MSDTQLHMTSPAKAYQKRRATLAKNLTRPMVIFSGHALARSYASNPHTFRAESCYLYFGGPPLEHAALMIEPGSDGQAGCTWFRTPPGPDDPLWLGPTPSDATCAAAIGIEASQVKDYSKLESATSKRNIACIIPPHPETLALACKLKLAKPTDEESLAIIDLRLIKDEHELAAMRYAAKAGVAAHIAAMRATRTGNCETDVQAALVAELTRYNCRESFSSICTIRGEVLHGECAGRKLHKGSLMLVDAGAEETGCYTSDMTRTYPVDGEWTEVQRHLYETVLRAEQSAIKACVPGKRYLDIHRLAAQIICEGLVDAELLKGTPAELADRGAYGLFFPHGVGHLLGMGVHDLEDFGDLAGYASGRSRPERFGDCFLRLDRDLAPGMVVTIEPGIYLVPSIWERDALVKPFDDVVNRSAVDALLDDEFGGIRIEEDVVIGSETSAGPEVLTAALPNDPDVVSAIIDGTII
ncbi:MAG: aminopeptidase P N-terminal domain-containing protein [Phycisphaerales bacterium]|nr:aminopeptidase P N-terminal domain-containing protein [Phycisphaerales bacterium]